MHGVDLQAYQILSTEKHLTEDAILMTLDMLSEWSSYMMQEISHFTGDVNSTWYDWALSVYGKCLDWRIGAMRLVRQRLDGDYLGWRHSGTFEDHINSIQETPLLSTEVVLATLKVVCTLIAPSPQVINHDSPHNYVKDAITRLKASDAPEPEHHPSARDPVEERALFDASLWMLLVYLKSGTSWEVPEHTLHAIREIFLSVETWDADWDRRTKITLTVLYWFWNRHRLSLTPSLPYGLARQIYHTVVAVLWKIADCGRDLDQETKLDPSDEKWWTGDAYYATEGVPFLMRRTLLHVLKKWYHSDSSEEHRSFCNNIFYGNEFEGPKSFYEKQSKGIFGIRLFEVMERDFVWAEKASLDGMETEEAAVILGSKWRIPLTTFPDVGAPIWEHPGFLSATQQQLNYAYDHQVHIPLILHTLSSEIEATRAFGLGALVKLIHGVWHNHRPF